MARATSHSYLTDNLIRMELGRLTHTRNLYTPIMKERMEIVLRQITEEDRRLPISTFADRFLKPLLS